MTKKIFNSIWIVAVSVFIFSALFFMGVLYNYFSILQKQQLETQVNMTSQGLENEGVAYLKDLDLGNYRITWIDQDGNVIFDNKADSSEMENHLNREEVKEAKKYGVGKSARYSTTFTEKSYYYAKKLKDGSIIRASSSQSTVLTLLLSMTQSILIIFILVILFSLILAKYATKKIVKPLNEIDLDHPLSNNEYDELSPLLHRLYKQQKEIKNKNDILEQKHSEFITITKGMQEGIVLLNTELSILDMNHAAMTLLDLDNTCIEQNILTCCSNLELQNVLQKAKDGKHVEKIIELSQGMYQLDISPVLLNDQVLGMAVLILNVTEKEKMEKLRREFSSNVSHELKTPLQTILGYAEIMSQGLVKDQDLISVSNKIYAESKRLIQLIQDIISLSNLDEGGNGLQWEKLNVYEVAQKSVNELKPFAEMNHVHIQLKGTNVYLQSVHQLLHTVFYNIIENAIKYNRENGAVNVSIKEDREQVYISITDTGIGMENKDLDRIFERFYRVDKSRSKEKGGTGLGLSIVKHAVLLLNGTIQVESKVNEGTTFKIVLPKEDE